MHLGFSSTDERAGGPRTGEISLSPYAKSGPSAIRDGRTLTWRRRAPQPRSLLRIRNRGFRVALRHHLQPMVCVNPVTHCRVVGHLMIALVRQGVSDQHGGAEAARLSSAAITRSCEKACRSRSHGWTGSRLARVRRPATRGVHGRLARVGWTGDSRVWAGARLARAAERTTRRCGATPASRVQADGRVARVDMLPFMVAGAC